MVRSSFYMDNTCVNYPDTEGLLHLFAMWVLQEPGHLGDQHIRISLVFLGWLGLLLPVHWLYRKPRWRSTAEYLYVLFPMVLLQFENLVDVGPAYGTTTLLIPALLGAVLIQPRPQMLWFATVAAQSAFTVFALLSNSQGRPPYSTEHILFFNLILLLIGVMIHLLLRQRGFIRG